MRLQRKLHHKYIGAVAGLVGSMAGLRFFARSKGVSVGTN